MTFTKEQLIAAAHGRIDFANMMLSDNPEPLKERTWAIELHLAKIALVALTAGMEQEPVAYMVCNGQLYQDRAFLSFSTAQISVKDRDDGAEIKPLYAAPQLPQPAVPDEMPEPDTARMFFTDAVVAIAKVQGWNACRAAMLQGAEPVQGWIPCSERMPDETQPVIVVSDGGVVQRTVYQFCEGVWIDWYEQYDEVSADAFTHWIPLPAAPQQEV